MLDNKWIKLQIWDTAGQERFRTITSGIFLTQAFCVYKPIVHKPTLVLKCSILPRRHGNPAGL